MDRLTPDDNDKHNDPLAFDPSSVANGSDGGLSLEEFEKNLASLNDSFERELQALDFDMSQVPRMSSADLGSDLSPDPVQEISAEIGLDDRVTSPMTDEAQIPPVAVEASSGTTSDASVEPMIQADEINPANEGQAQGDSDPAVVSLLEAEDTSDSDMMELEKYSDRVDAMTDDERKAVRESPEGAVLANAATEIVNEFELSKQEGAAHKAASEAFATITEDDLYQPASSEEQLESYLAQMNATSTKDTAPDFGFELPGSFDEPPKFVVDAASHGPFVPESTEQGQQKSVGPDASGMDPLYGVIGGRVHSPDMKTATHKSSLSGSRPATSPGATLLATAQGEGSDRDNEMRHARPQNLQVMDPISRTLNLAVGAAVGTVTGIAGLATSGYDKWHERSLTRQNTELARHVSSFQDNVAAFNAAENSEQMDRSAKLMKKDLLNIKTGMAGALESASMLVSDERKAAALISINSHLETVQASAARLKDSGKFDVKETMEQMKELAETIKEMAENMARMVRGLVERLFSSLGTGLKSAKAGPSAGGPAASGAGAAPSMAM